MAPDPAWFRDAVASGDPARVDEALSALRRTWPSERPALLAACVPFCRDLFRSEDAYQRQSAVRFLRELAAATEGLTRHELDGLGSTGDPFAGFEETLLAAVRDDDGRVRRSAVPAIGALAAAHDRRGARAALERLHGVLATYEAVTDDRSTADALREARRAVAAESDAVLSPDDKVCPRCGATVERWTLGEHSTVECVACGYAGVAVDVSATPTTTESWDDAVARFRERLAVE